MPKILVIEDDADMHEAVKLMLEPEGYAVTWCSTGPAGLEQAQRMVPDLILLDIMLSSPSEGFHLAYELRKDDVLRNIPIIMLTVLNDPDTRRQSLSVGAVDFIPKDSFMNMVLLETLRQLEVLTEQDSGVNDTK